jgi:GT2 family glycosyltransferase
MSQEEEHFDEGGGTCLVAVVNYFSAAMVRRAIKELRTKPGDKVAILDNSCNNNEWQRIAALGREDDRIEVFRSPRNVGFGSGNNQLIAQSNRRQPHESVWILNPDAIPDPFALPRLRAALSQNTKAVLSPRILMGSASEPKVWFDGGTVDLRTGNVKHRHYGIPAAHVGQGRTPYSTGFMTGTAPFMAMKTWQIVGGYRKDFFLYWEDVDFTLRCLDLNIPLMVLPSAVVWHEEGGTSRRNSPGTLKWLLRPWTQDTDRRLAKTAAAARGSIEGVALSIAQGIGIGSRRD